MPDREPCAVCGTPYSAHVAAIAPKNRENGYDYVRLIKDHAYQPTANDPK